MSGAGDADGAEGGGGDTCMPGPEAGEKAELAKGEVCRVWYEVSRGEA